MNRYGTRPKYVFHELKCNTVTYRGSFYSDSVRCWNRIGHLFRKFANLKSFKTKLLAGYRSIPNSSFGIFDPLGVKRLFQQRVGLSPFLEHIKNHNFLDTHSGICTTCNSPENLEHFLLYCICFTEARLIFLNANLLLNRNVLPLEPNEETRFLMYGDKLLSNDNNIQATLKYLKETERFS